MTARIPTRSIVALSIAGCGSSAALRVCDPLIPYLAREHDTGLAAAAQTVTAFAIAYGLFQLIYGPVGDRYGKYRVITIATFACALTSLACAFAPSLASLVVARALAGATAGALIPLSLAWIGDVVPYERRQSVLARYLIGQMFGIALGQVLGGVGADLYGSGPVFVALAAWFAAAALLLRRFVPAQERSAAHDQDGALRRYVAVLEVGWSRVVLFTVYVEGLLLVGALAFVPTHLHLTYGLPLTAAGTVVMLFAAGGLVFAALSPLLVRGLGEPGLAAVGGVLLALCLGVLALPSTPAVAALACLVGGLGFYMLHNTLQVNATQMAPAQRGSSLALFACILFVGHSTGVTLAGSLVERIGTGPVIAAAGGLLLFVGSAFAFALQNRRRVSAGRT
ncbi:MAG: MFS transporter [Burkholderiales bacterium]|nr:MFS transporter [Burkholderiales bacterium]